MSAGDGDSRGEWALAEVADLLVQNKLVIPVQTFPSSEQLRPTGSVKRDVRGKLVLVP